MKGRAGMLKRFIQDESGATAIEYGLIAALISVSLIAGYSAIASDLETQFTNTAGEIQTAGSGHLNP